jgi:hypothetical protein
LQNDCHKKQIRVARAGRKIQRAILVWSVLSRRAMLGGLVYPAGRQLD